MGDFFESHEKKIYFFLALILVFAIIVWNRRTEESLNLMKITLLIQNHRYAAAIDSLEDLEKKKKSFEGYVGLSVLFLDMGVHKDDTDIPRAIYNLAYQMTYQPDYGKYASFTAAQCYSLAQEMAGKAHELSPKNADVLSLLGVISILENHFDEAKQYVKEAIDLAENSNKKSSYQTLMAMIYCRELREGFNSALYEDAITHIENAIKHNSNNDKAYEVYGDLMVYRLENKNRAKMYYTKALETYRANIESINKKQTEKSKEKFDLDLIKHISPSELEKKIKYSE